MEIDFIFLKKENTKSDLSLKGLVFELLKKNFIEEDGSIYYIDEEDIKQEVSYQMSENNNNIYMKITCPYSEMKAADILDKIKLSMQRGKHKANLNVILIYDEVSQTYCCKLMKYFGIFERRLRQLMYLTLIKAFGIEWYERSFTEAMKTNLQAKTHGQKEMLIEGALNELAYEELKTYLFEPSSTIDSILNQELSKDKLEELSKEDIINYINLGRKCSLWDRFFSNIKGLENLQDNINYLQPNRNKVMHHKTLSKQDFISLRKIINEVNNKLEIAILNIENRIYTENDLKQVLSAIGRTFAQGLGNIIENWQNSFRPLLSALGQITTQAIASTYDVKMIMPLLESGIGNSKQVTKTMKAITNSFATSYDFKSVNKIVENMNGTAQIMEKAIGHYHLNTNILKQTKEQAQRLHNLILPMENIISTFESKRLIYESIYPKILGIGDTLTDESKIEKDIEDLNNDQIHDNISEDEDKNN